MTEFRTCEDRASPFPQIPLIIRSAKKGTQILSNLSPALWVISSRRHAAGEKTLHWRISRENICTICGFSRSAFVMNSLPRLKSRNEPGFSLSWLEIYFSSSLGRWWYPSLVLLEPRVKIFPLLWTTFEWLKWWILLMNSRALEDLRIAPPISRFRVITRVTGFSSDIQAQGHHPRLGLLLQYWTCDTRVILVRKAGSDLMILLLLIIIHQHYLW